MTKTQTVLLWVIIGAALIWLLWRNREDVAPMIFNTPPPNYLDVAYPSISIQAPALQMPESGASCGCNPAASQFMSGVAAKVAAAESNIESQLSEYTDSINAYFATQYKQ